MVRSCASAGGAAIAAAMNAGMDIFNASRITLVTPWRRLLSVALCCEHCSNAHCARKSAVGATVVDRLEGRKKTRCRAPFLGRQHPEYRGMSTHPAGGRANGKCLVKVLVMSIPRASRALERFTVLDLTRVRSGPTCVRQLADWGANVIKIETPPQIEGAGDAPGGPRDGPDFQNLHRNKRSITLNLKSKDGLAAFKRLVKKADVVVENFRPDVKKRLGIDYKDLKKVNPKIILGSISGF